MSVGGVNGWMSRAHEISSLMTWCSNRCPYFCYSLKEHIVNWDVYVRWFRENLWSLA